MLFITYFAMISMSSIIDKSLSLVLIWDDIVIFYFLSFGKGAIVLFLRVL